MDWEYEYVNFIGTIKNKSELKRVLKMIGIDGEEESKTTTSN